MSFNIALTGLAAAQKDLDVTANNIANVNTRALKSLALNLLMYTHHQYLAPVKRKMVMVYKPLWLPSSFIRARCSLLIIHWI
jgi:flagellar basal body rod protein FlgG